MRVDGGLLFLCLSLTVISGQVDSYLGCRKPAPPKCCPGTCPRCLPVNKRHNAAAAGRSSSLPVSVRRRKADQGGPEMEGKSFLPNSQRRPLLLDERDFYRIDDWAIPKGDCVGADCACANCVCCYTETLLYSTTTTCTATQTLTFVTTSTFTSFFGLTTFLSKTNHINFTVTNTLQYISTLSKVVTAPTPISLIFSVQEVTTSFQTFWVRLSTAFGAVGTVYSPLPQTQTVRTSFTITSFVSAEISLFTPLVIPSTLSLASATTTSIVTLGIYKCNYPLTVNVTDTLRETATLYTTALSTPIYTLVDASVTLTASTTAETLTFTRCSGIDTVRYTPTRTIVAGTLTPTSEGPPDLGCNVCARA